VSHFTAFNNKDKVPEVDVRIHQRKDGDGNGNDIKFICIAINWGNEQITLHLPKNDGDSFAGDEFMKDRLQHFKEIIDQAFKRAEHIEASE
jgi:hypothetical protein